jgi:hypothetical protein
MRVEMENHLPSASVHIDKEPVTRVCYPEVSGDLCRGLSDMGKNVILGRYVIQGWDVLSRNNENMHRPDGIGIPERYQIFILVHLISRYLSRYNVAEHTILGRLTH